MESEHRELLIIDDSPEHREIHAGFLEPLYRIREAGLGREGLAMIRERRPDCVLLDYRLPDIDGLQVLEALQADTVLATVPVVVLSGHGDAHVAVSAMRAGAVDFLDKNALTSATLRQAVDNVCEKARLRAEVERERQRLHIMLASIHDGVLAVDHQSRITVLNGAAASLIGCNTDEVMGQAVADILLLRDEEAGIDWRDRMAQLLEEGKGSGPESKDGVWFGWLTSRRGHDIGVEYRLTPVLDPAGHVESLVLSLKDVTRHKQAEAALRSSEERLRLALDGARMGTFHWNIVTGDTVWSDTYLAILGFPPGTPGSQEVWLASLHPEDRARIEQLYRHAMATRGDIDAEYRILRPDGATRWLAARGRFLYGPDGTPHRMEGVIQDISERHALEEEIRTLNSRLESQVQERTTELSQARTQIQNVLEQVRSSEAQFRAIFEQAPLGIALIDSRTEKFDQVNERFTTITGWTRQELTATDWARITHPDDVSEERDNLARLNAGEITVIHMNQRYLRPDGKVVWVSMTTAALTGVSGGPPRHLKLIEDITERMRLEEALVHSEERYRLVVDASSEGFWEADLINERLIVNEHWYTLLGYRWGEVTPTYELFRSHLHPDDVDEYEHIFTEHLLGRSPHYECEYRIITKTGELHWQQGFGKVVQCNAEGQALRIVGTFSDITVRKQVEQALLDAEQRARVTKERLELALNVSGLGLWEFRWANRCMHLDERANRMLGYGAIDTNLAETDWLGWLHPDDRSDVEEAMARHESGETPALEMEYRIRHQDGYWLWVQARGKITVRDASANPTVALGTLLDISQQKRALDESATLLRRIQETLHQAARLPVAIESYASSRQANPLDQLTSRQMEVLRLIASGLTSAQIAEKLKISISTVRAHRRDLMQTLGLHSAAEVTRFALREKLIAEE